MVLALHLAGFASGFAGGNFDADRDFSFEVRGRMLFGLLQHGEHEERVRQQAGRLRRPHLWGSLSVALFFLLHPQKSSFPLF
jgi:hypothetical protein